MAARAGEWPPRCIPVPGLKGYVGIDMVLSDDECYVIEINPRLTTSYLGLPPGYQFQFGGSHLAALAVKGCTSSRGCHSSGNASFRKEELSAVPKSLA